MRSRASNLLKVHGRGRWRIFPCQVGTVGTVATVRMVGIDVTLARHPPSNLPRTSPHVKICSMSAAEERCRPESRRRRMFLIAFLIWYSVTLASKVPVSPYRKHSPLAMGENIFDIDPYILSPAASSQPTECPRRHCTERLRDRSNPSLVKAELSAIVCISNSFSVVYQRRQTLIARFPPLLLLLLLLLLIISYTTRTIKLPNNPNSHRR